MYTKTKKGCVTLGDAYPCKVAGIGTIKVRMFDRMVWTLTNVKHVLKLKENLVSLDYLKRNGYKFNSHSRSGILNITNGAMIVIREKRMENKLYRMEGSMGSGGSEIVVAAKESTIHTDCGILPWPHGRLRYEGAKQEWKNSRSRRRCSRGVCVNLDR